jgi:hypothetical protein
VLPSSGTTLRHKTFVHIYQITRCHTSENHGLDTNPHEHCVLSYTAFFLETAVVLRYRVFGGQICSELNSVYCMQARIYARATGRQISKGGTLKKSRLKYGMREKKAVHEREI